MIFNILDIYADKLFNQLTVNKITYFIFVRTNQYNSINIR